MRALFSASLRTSGSALVLVENNKTWDADILIRPTVEASIKLTFLLSNKSLFKERYKEYSEMLFDIENIKSHNKALSLLNALKKPQENEWKAIRDLVFSEEDYKI
jgi:hypothetical protein